MRKKTCQLRLQDWWHLYISWHGILAFLLLAIRRRKRRKLNLKRMICRLCIDTAVFQFPSQSMMTPQTAGENGSFELQDLLQSAGEEEGHLTLALPGAIRKKVTHGTRLGWDLSRRGKSLSPGRSGQFV